MANDSVLTHPKLWNSELLMQAESALAASGRGEYIEEISSWLASFKTCEKPIFSARHSISRKNAVQTKNNRHTTRRV